ncbi:MAG: J domain-containing protein [Lachnospiraceae bacterium]|nr:J domain-containing protein [Lachnospiraceae bacterium]
MSENNIWEILGLESGATKKEIKRQYAKLSKECHPEEKPEEFARLHQAYQTAMKLCDDKASKVVKFDFPNNDYEKNAQVMQLEESEETKESEKTSTASTYSQSSLLDKLNQNDENDLEAYVNNGIIKTIIDTLSDKKRRNKPAVWQEIFLSEEFLSEQFKEIFADGMEYVFRNIPKVENVNEVPSAFLTELAIAYGITVEENGMYRFGNGLKIEQVITDYWFSMPEEWYSIRATGYLKKKQNRVRAVSFGQYRALLSMHESTFNNDSERLKWQEIIWGLRAEYFIENDKTSDDLATLSRILIDLCIFWLEHYKIPDHVVTYIYKSLYLDNLESISYGEWYRPLKECISRCYPDLECLDTQKKEIKNKFVTEYMDFCALNSKLEDAMYENKDFDKTLIDEKCDALFESDIWKEYAKDPVIINYLVETGGFVHMYYKAIDKMFCTYYDENKLYEDKEADLLENLIRARSFSSAIPTTEDNERAAYILMYAFGIRRVSGVEIYDKYGMYGSDGIMNMPMYIDYLFCVKELSEYDTETFEHKFLDGNTLKYSLEYKNVRVFWNENEVYGDILSPAEVLTYAEELSGSCGFFALLSILDRKAYHNSDKDLKQSIRKCIEKWLIPLEITLNIRNRIIDCILMGEDEIANLGKFGICYGGGGKLYIVEKGAKLIPYLYSVKGLTRLPEYIGAKGVTDLETALKIYSCPKPELIKEYDISGLSEEEISNVIFEALMLNAKVNEETKVNKKDDDTYNVPYVKEYMEREGRFIRNAFVTLDRNTASSRREVFAVSLLDNKIFGFGFKGLDNNSDNDLYRTSESILNNVSDSDIYGEFRKNARELEEDIMRRNNERSIVIGYFTRDYGNYFKRPIAIGESGNLYIKTTFSNIVSGKSIKDIMKDYLPLSRYEKVEVYANVLAMSRFGNTFNYNFKDCDFADKDSLANYYAKFI